jgi:hypothetical protein
MTKKIKQIASAPKRIASHVYVRRGRYGVAAGIIAGSVIARNLDNETYKEAIAFIKLKGLDEEFFNPMEYDWQDMV